MALTDNQPTTKTAMRDVFTAKMEGLFPLDGSLSQADKDAIRGNWRKMGEAISEILGPLCVHITTNGSIDGQTGHIS